MENSRRPPFDRSREPGSKKPRLTEETVALDRGSNGRSNFIQRPANSGLAGSRFRASERGGGDSESSESVRGSYPPQQQQHQELVNQYKKALSELTFNSKPIITNLTIIAGENLHAAKAVAATVCAHILEVPREQKLPSLYLLDSIVKNIGRDYIKYFATRLPEVFCKAYKQVDPSVHPGMRHLFGTWKGVFPPQSLQMIEKELGFVSAINGSSLGTSRSDASATRTAHSIHVNPKYLEARQQFQHSTRAKGAPSDVSGNMVNSSNAMERPDRTSSISSGRPWTDNSVKHNRNLQREQLSEVHEKNISTTFGDFEYDSDISRRSGLEMERPDKSKEQTLDKSWYDPLNVRGKVLNQRNGFDVKHGVQSYTVPKSASIQPTHSFNSQSTSELTRNWKNSEEEEYTWDDINSRLTNHGATNSSGIERWTPEDSERTSEASADSLSTEQKGQAVFGSRISSSWSQEPRHSDGMRNPLSTGDVSGHSESYPSVLTGLSTTASATGRGSFQSKVGPGNIGAPSHVLPSNASPSTQSPVHQRLSSPSFGSLTGNQAVHHLAEKDQLRVKSRAETITQVPRQLSVDPRTKFKKSLPKPSQSIHLPNERPQSANIRIPTSMGPSPHLKHQVSFIQKLNPEAMVSEPSHQAEKSLPSLVSDCMQSSMTLNTFPVDPIPLGLQSSGQSSTSSLLAAVMNSGILGNISGTGSLPHLGSQDTGGLGKRPPPSGPPPTKLTLLDPRISPSVSSQPINEMKSHPSVIPPKIAERPPLPPGHPPSSLVGSISSESSKATDVSTPMSSLLSSLVAKGLITASKTETPTSVTSQIPDRPPIQNPGIACTSSVEVSPTQGLSPLSSSSSMDELPSPRPPPGCSDLPHSTVADVKNQIGFQFKPDILRERHEPVISELLYELPYKCGICGLRLKFQERLDRHLHWHSLRNQNMTDLDKAIREWYVNLADWITGATGYSPIDKSTSLPGVMDKSSENKELMVPADESQCLCIMCGELFDDYYSVEMDQWMFKGAVYATIPSSEVESENSGDGGVQNSIVHAKCVPNISTLDLGLPKDVKLEKCP